MKINIENIGMIEKSEVIINGLTVVAGENNTGKSTIGKSLYSIFTSLYDYENELLKVKIEAIIHEIRAFVYLEKERRLPSIILRALQEDIEFAELTTGLIANKENISDHLEQIFVFFEEKGMKIDREDSEFQNLEDKINTHLSVENDEILRKIFNRIFSREFSNQINTSGKDLGKIELEIKDKNIRFDIYDDNVSKYENIFPLTTDIVYIDNPYILDFIEKGAVSLSPMIKNIGNNLLLHQEDLLNKLRKDADLSILNTIQIEKKLNLIFKKITDVTNSGMLKIYGRNIVFEDEGNKLKIGNLSSGLKTFLIIQTLLLNGSIKENGILILDEPEVHLHPEWQVILAEVIVAIQKEFNLHILLTTHSPYFLFALEVFTKKYHIENETHYYLAEKEISENEKNISLSNVTGKVEMIYQKLSAPFELLEQLESEAYDNEEY